MAAERGAKKRYFLRKIFSPPKMLTEFSFKRIITHSFSTLPRSSVTPLFPRHVNSTWVVSRYISTLALLTYRRIVVFFFSLSLNLSIFKPIFRALFNLQIRSIYNIFSKVIRSSVSAVWRVDSWGHFIDFPNFRLVLVFIWYTLSPHLQGRRVERTF